MGAGIYSGEPTGDPAGIPSDPEAWSDKSKQSVAYLFPPRPYIDKAFNCWRCGVPCVYSAAEQKHNFEVRKVRIEQQRIRCRPCHAAWCRAERELRACRRRWASERSALLHDAEFLRRWLELLETSSRNNGRWDTANIIMVRRLLGEIAARSDPAENPAAVKSEPRA